MRSFFTVLATLAVFSYAASSQAITISVEDSIPGSQLSIFVDVAPENAKFTNGGIDLKLTSSNPGVVEFTNASVHMPTLLGGAVQRWTTGVVQGLTADSISLIRGGAIGSVGLDPAIPGNVLDGSSSRFLFATVDYSFVGPGVTEILPGEGTPGESFVNNGAVMSNVELVGVSLDGGIIPEPSSMILASMGLIGLVLRRRNG